jgi:hypothetical protein
MGAAGQGTIDNYDSLGSWKFKGCKNKPMIYAKFAQIMDHREIFYWHLAATDLI